MTVVPTIIELQGRFPGLGKVWATTVHERLRYAKRKSFHEQVADQIIQSVVKKRKISLLDLDESELAAICPDSAMLNSRYGGRYRVQDTSNRTKNFSSITVFEVTASVVDYLS